MTDEYLETIQDMNNEDLIQKLVSCAIDIGSNGPDDEKSFDLLVILKEEVSLRMAE